MPDGRDRRRSADWKRSAAELGALHDSMAVVLLGRGLPYWVLTAVFLLLHHPAARRERTACRPGSTRGAILAPRSSRRSWRPSSRWCSSTSSWFGCPEADAMFDGLVDVRQRGRGLSQPVSLALAFGATLLGIVAGCMPGLSATLVHHAADDADAQDAAERRRSWCWSAPIMARSTAAAAPRSCSTFPAPPPTPPPASTAMRWRGRARPAAPWASRPPGSVLGTLFGLVCLALFTPLLGEIALNSAPSSSSGSRCSAS